MLLFLPGLICDARVFAPQLAAFAGSRAVDGYGTGRFARRRWRGWRSEQAPEPIRPVRPFDGRASRARGVPPRAASACAGSRCAAPASIRSAQTSRPSAARCRRSVTSAGSRRWSTPGCRRWWPRPTARTTALYAPDAADVPRAEPADLRRADRGAARPARAGEPAAADRVPDAGHDRRARRLEPAGAARGDRRPRSPIPLW